MPHIINAMREVVLFDRNKANFSIQEPASDAAVSEIENLKKLLWSSAASASGMFIAGILRNTELRNYLISRTASMAGRKGGRPKGSQPHIDWIEKKIRYLRSHGCEDYTAKDLFDELRHDSNVDGEDDEGNLIFKATFLEDNGWTNGKIEPSITLNAVAEALTLINKSKLKTSSYGRKFRRKGFCQK